VNIDVVVLKLDRPIPTDEITPIVFSLSKTVEDLYEEKESFTLGGYSADKYKGAEGENLTYDQTCKALHGTSERIYTDCSAYHGASGGALVVEARNDQGELVPYFMGVAIGGFNHRTDRIVVNPAPLFEYEYSDGDQSLSSYLGDKEWW
jgi:hypothetical protein